MMKKLLGVTLALIVCGFLSANHLAGVRAQEGSEKDTGAAPETTICICHLFPYAQYPDYCSYYAEKCYGEYPSIDDTNCNIPFQDCANCPDGTHQCHTVTMTALQKLRATHGQMSKAPPLPRRKHPTTRPTLDSSVQLLGEYYVKFTTKVSGNDTDIYAKVFLTLVDPKQHTPPIAAPKRIFGTGVEIEKVSPALVDFVADKATRVVDDHVFQVEVGATSYLVTTTELKP